MTTTDPKAAVRPQWFSKRLAICSMLEAVARLEDRVGWRAAFDLLIDDEGDLPDLDDRWLDAHGVRVHRLGGRGNAGALAAALDLAAAEPDDRLVYLVEDDYLHVPEALIRLQDAAEHLPTTTYLTPYDHPVRYAVDYPTGLDLPTRATRIEWIHGRHWRPHESTCMTFASRAGTLREDRPVFRRYMTGSVPNDRELFRRLQGLVGYEQDSPGRELYGPMPSLATHCHEPWLAPGGDWAVLAASLREAWSCA